MTSPICAILSGTLSGATRQGALTPITLGYSLDSQSAHQQLSPQVEAGETKVVNLPTNLGGPNASPDGQTLMVVTCDLPGVEITLNSAGTPIGPFTFQKANGFLIFPGQVGSPAVAISDLSINNPSGTQRASLSVTVIYGQ